jgi:glucokinase
LPGSGAGAFFAVDVGGSSVKSALVIDGKVEHPSREPVARDLDGLVRQIVRLCEAAGAPAWGLCIAGLVDPELGTVRYSANLGLHDAAIVELLEAELPSPKVFANDLVASTVGEADGHTLALLQIGTGIAARCAVEGIVPPSATGHAGEVGHLRFRAGGRPCRCGNRGCAEAYGAWGGIADRYAEAERPASTPAELLRVGGGVAAAWGETLLEAIRSALKEQVLPDVAAVTVVESARLGDSAALIGLAALARSVR